jgi:hypothetical protein
LHRTAEDRIQDGNERRIGRLLGKRVRARGEDHGQVPFLSHGEGLIWVSRFSEAINRRLPSSAGRPGAGARR